MARNPSGKTMKIVQLSAKNLGGLALPSFCPRCFWIRLKCRDKLPFQTFPGIFSSIDSYSKKVTLTHFRQHGRLPKWFDGFGRLGTPIPVPGWSRFQMLDRETNVLVTGVPDEILRHARYGIWIGDYKTARFTDCQDALAPMYATQLNCYGVIAPKIGLGPVYRLGLLYYEPVTDPGIVDTRALIKAGSFFLEFSPKIRPVKLEPEIIPPCYSGCEKLLTSRGARQDELVVLIATHCRPSLRQQRGPFHLSKRSCSGL